MCFPRRLEVLREWRNTALLSEYRQRVLNERFKSAAEWPLRSAGGKDGMRRRTSLRSAVWIVRYITLPFSMARDRHNGRHGNDVSAHSPGSHDGRRGERAHDRSWGREHVCDRVHYSRDQACSHSDWKRRLKWSVHRHDRRACDVDDHREDSQCARRVLQKCGRTSSRACECVRSAPRIECFSYLIL
jgi:hypothetical protein